MFKTIVLLLFAGAAVADLRMASQPKRHWKTQQRNRDVPFQSRFALYMEPSDFKYDGLIKQRDEGAYDNFLRSNIDNEQDRRDFDTEDGKDHLPFRSYETAATDIGQTTVKHKIAAARSNETLGIDAAGDHIFAEPGVPYVIPLRWNNPHSAELEVNIWLMKLSGGPYVIPVMKPTCSGEGWKDNVFTFTVPADFNTVASCSNIGDCVLQVYAHSVESRMYASGTPIIVKSTPGVTPTTLSAKPAEQDTAFDLNKLRRLCLPRGRTEAAHTNAVIYEARLSSDVYNHAFQNSDFSPYAGQQPLLISQNLQASAILKMTVGNFGELGKRYMQQFPEARKYANKLDKKARDLIRLYETMTNAIILVVEKIPANTGGTNSASMESGRSVPVGSVPCDVWKDRYDRANGPRTRGTDKTGGYCEIEYTCLCHSDCIAGYGPGDSLGEDAYCAKLDADGKVIAGTEKPRNLPAQMTETCFRCAEIGSTATKRLNTNTYIPSFEIRSEEAVAAALDYIAPIYLESGFLTNPDTGEISQKGDTKAILQIYMAALSDMWPEFKSVSDGSYLQMHYPNKYDDVKDTPAFENYKFTYRGPVLKTTTSTLDHETKFKKIDASSVQDNGLYASTVAWKLQARGTGSSYAVPDTAGPLRSGLDRYNNMHITDPTGNPAVVYKFPPDPAPSTSCASLSSDAQLKLEGDITEEGVDMDGLNRDADCDNDEAITKMQAEHDAACLAEAEKDSKYECPPYPEPTCYIEGQDKMLPTQMFQNQLGFGSTGSTNSAAAVVPSSVAILLAAATLL